MNSPASHISTESCETAEPPFARFDVSHFRQDMSDAELDLHIKHCGRLMEVAFHSGDRQQAIEWQSAMYAAIGIRKERRLG